MTDRATFRGPPSLGRGIVMAPGDSLPDDAETWPVIEIDESTLGDPDKTLDELDGWWRARTPSVVVLGIPLADIKAPESDNTPPYLLTPAFEFGRERLHFLIWANRYDARSGTMRWHHGERAIGLGAEACRDDAGDVIVDGVPVWVDGGPRGARDDDLAVIHVESVWSGRLQLDLSPSPAATAALDQQAAIGHPVGPARIIAPAGSGKTLVLTQRMRHLLAERGWNTDAVTALAYNRRAAEEMANRVGVPAHVRTIHAFGYEILGRARGGRPRLLAEREVRRILDRLAPVKPRANEDVYAPYIEALSEVRNALRPPKEVEEDRDDVPGLTGLFDDYRAAMADQGGIDHDEQIYGALEALLADPELRAWAASRCRHLLVDEFQDLTPAHLLMLRLLAAPAYDVFGVGDDDQVIYGYAGASPEFLIDYADYFPGAAHHALEVNYRCPIPVVEAARSLLGHNRRRVPKTIRGASTLAEGLEAIVVTETEAGSRLVEVVESLTSTSGPESVAVLTRVNVGLLVPQITLAEAGITASQTLDQSLLDRSGVRAAMAWLRLAGSVARDEPMAGADLTEATRRPARGLSPGVRTALGRGTWTLDRLAAFADGSTDDRTRKRLATLVEDVFLLSRIAADGGGVAAQLVACRDKLGLGAALDRLDNSRTHPTGGHADDIDALVMLAHTHPQVAEFDSWLRVCLARPDGGGPAVTLSTVHRVKGLEWPHVVVWDATAGVMPHRLADDTEEERRIFHVALTRCSVSTTVISRRGSVSPFVAQLAAETGSAA